MALCPFCSAVKQTLSEEMFSTDAVVIAKVVGPGTSSVEGFDLRMKLEVTQVLKGKGLIEDKETFETIVPASFQAGQECLVMGVVTDSMSWSTPMKLTPRSKTYVLDIQKLPAEGPMRLRFFVSYLEDEESLLAYDAYDEFARAPYEDVIAIKADINHENLLKWITDPEVTINRKRLYYTLLGVCGSKADLKLLEKLITSDNKKERAALDALAACYLTLAGEDGVALIEDKFLRNKEADYVDTYAAVAALRFHGTESKVIPLPRILQAIRLMLDRPEVADLVIPDLARWKDWSAMDKLVDMFKNANEKTNWVRVPIINYLRVCPKPEAKEKIEELRKVDAQAVRRALAFFDLEEGIQEDTQDDDSTFEQELKKLKNDDDQDKSKSDGGNGGGTNESQVSDSAVSLPVTASQVSSKSRLVTLKPTLPENQLDVVPNQPPAQLNSDQLDDIADIDVQPISTSFQDLSTPGMTLEYVQAEETQDAEPKIQLINNQDDIENLIPVKPEPVKTPSTNKALPVDAANAGLERTASSRPLPSNPPEPPALRKSYFWWILGIPVAANVLLLILAWSLFSGTFSRLFC